MVPIGAPEKPQLVLDNGAADRTTVFVVDSPGNGDRHASVCRVFAGSTESEQWALLAVRKGAPPAADVVFETAAMKTVCAGLCHIIHYRAHIASILRPEVVGDDLNFGYRVRAAEEDLRAAYVVVVIILSIDLEVVGAAALAVG